MTTPVWSHYPLVSAEPQGRSWLTLLSNLGRSPATVEAYGRGLDQYIRFCNCPGRAAARPSGSAGRGGVCAADFVGRR